MYGDVCEWRTRLQESRDQQMAARQQKTDCTQKGSLGSPYGDRVTGGYCEDTEIAFCPTVSTLSTTVHCVTDMSLCVHVCKCARAHTQC